MSSWLYGGLGTSVRFNSGIRDVPEKWHSEKLNHLHEELKIQEQQIRTLYAHNITSPITNTSARWRAPRSPTSDGEGFEEGDDEGFPPAPPPARVVARSD